MAPPCGMGEEGEGGPRAPGLQGKGEWGGVWHRASVSGCLPLAAPIGLSFFAHSDPLWARTCFGCVNGAPGRLVQGEQGGGQPPLGHAPHDRRCRGGAPAMSE